MWTVKWQQAHNYQQPNLKKQKLKLIKQRNRTVLIYEKQLYFSLQEDKKILLTLLTHFIFHWKTDMCAQIYNLIESSKMENKTSIIIIGGKFEKTCTRFQQWVSMW